MPDNFSSPQVVCRPALPSDAADVLEFTKSIWEGHDYIQYVWRDWLADPQGLLAVAQYAGHAVALGKVSFLSPGQWWLEGVRVDTRYQGLKIGSHIFRYLDDWWKEHAGGVCRFMTRSEGVQMHHLAERFGYVKVGEVRSCSAAALEAATDRFQAVQAADVADAARFARARLPEFNGLMDSDWRFSRPDELVLAEKADEHRLYWWRGGRENGLLAFWEGEEDGGRILGIGFAAVAVGALRDMLSDIRGLARRLGFARALWLAPVKPPVESALKAAGYESDWDGTGFLYEKMEGP